MRRFLGKYILYILLGILVSSLGYYCFKQFFQKNIQANIAALNNDTWENIVRNAVDKYVGKTLILPYVDSLYIEESDYHDVCELPIKVVCFLDGDCSTCLMKTSFWKKFISEVSSQGFHEIPVIMYGYSSFEENFRDYMNAAWSGPWQFDGNRAFIEYNKLYDLRLQTLLLDSANNVILIGDPLLNPTLRELYMKTILSFCRDE